MYRGCDNVVYTDLLNVSYLGEDGGRKREKRRWRVASYLASKNDFTYLKTKKY